METDGKKAALKTLLSEMHGWNKEKLRAKKNGKPVGEPEGEETVEHEAPESPEVESAEHVPGMSEEGPELPDQKQEDHEDILLKLLAKLI